MFREWLLKSFEKFSNVHWVFCIALYVSSDTSSMVTDSVSSLLIDKSGLV